MKKELNEINKPKYSLFKNTTYALQGMIDLIKNEASFKLELLVLLIVIPFILYIDKSNIEKLFLFSSVFLVLIVEAVNGAIERVVDLVTNEYMELAGQAKDAGSAAVFLSVVLTIIVWGVIFIL